ncbi:hypothetical protein PHLGIDRAFT_224507 [Phlebiopsis gigantea 11061_1 CR5-6]|uniref:Uncharacterized protein n=1 Tax=Phlebiopsis gigantea (strain 11061_1 CR5-6) TaxID=745531 RepID=A0A0C3PEC4_PHLG1|nr:hypothetical protein PHLGIDRAFT_224507 [Phlebiopsis gigantea 11061_1 CR5-6]
MHQKMRGHAHTKPAIDVIARVGPLSSPVACRSVEAFPFSTGCPWKQDAPQETARSASRAYKRRVPSSVVPANSRFEIVRLDCLFDGAVAACLVCDHHLARVCAAPTRLAKTQTCKVRVAQHAPLRDTRWHQLNTYEVPGDAPTSGAGGRSRAPRTCHSTCARQTLAHALGRRAEEVAGAAAPSSCFAGVSRGCAVCRKG